MGFLDRLRGRSTDMRRTSGGFTTVRTADSADAAHLEDFVRTRQGVEAYLEPRTAVSDVTVLLVAHDGEWTRRRIADFDAALEFGRKRQIPVYEVARVGYPKRMRDYMARQKKAGGGA